MKSIKKNQIIKISIILGVLILLFLPFYNLLAQEEDNTETGENEIPINLRIPGLTKKCTRSDLTDRYCVTNFGEYIIQFYQWFARAAGIFAVVMILFAGYQWVTAQGNSSKIEKAKATLNGAMIGLVLTLGAYVLLNTINPALVRFKLLPLSNISKNVLATFYCKDLPDNEEVLDKLPPYQCGTKYNIPEDEREGTGYTESYCCGSTCRDTDDEGNRQICVNDYTLKGDCPLRCVNQYEACNEADKEECYKIDEKISEGYTCIPRGDECIITKAIFKPCMGFNDLERVNCNFKGLESKSLLDKYGSCTDSEKITAHQGFCCGYLNKSWVWCLPEPPQVDKRTLFDGRGSSITLSDENIIEVDCDTPILQFDESYNDMVGTFRDNTTTNCSDKCFVVTGCGSYSPSSP